MKKNTDINRYTQNSGLPGQQPPQGSGSAGVVAEPGVFQVQGALELQAGGGWLMFFRLKTLLLISI